jgi:hypothetical protein
MGNPQKNLWQIFVEECKLCLVDICTPLIVVARWVRRHIGK